MNFAPCVDVNVNPESPATGKYERSFSSDTAIVAACARAWVEGHRRHGVISVLKHFPGHGSALADSHFGMADVTDTWQPYELAPYRDLFASTQIDMVMISHVFNRHIDADYPATLSTKIIDGILRKEMGVEGVVISDDMNMKAIENHYSMERAIELSINAGCDMLIISNNIEEYDAMLPLKAVDIIEKLVASGKIQSSRIDEAYNRIMRLKRKLR